MLPKAWGGMTGSEFSFEETLLSEWKEKYHKGLCISVFLYIIMCVYSITLLPESLLVSGKVLSIGNAKVGKALFVLWVAQSLIGVTI